MTLLNHSVTHPPPFPFFGPPSCLQPGSQYMFSNWYAFSFHMLTSMHLSRQKCFQIGRKQNTPWIRDFTYLFNLKKRTEFQTILMKYPNIKILHRIVMNLSHCQSHQEISMLIYTCNIKSTTLCTYKFACLIQNIFFCNKFDFICFHFDNILLKHVTLLFIKSPRPNAHLCICTARVVKLVNKKIIKCPLYFRD